MQLHVEDGETGSGASELCVHCAFGLFVLKSCPVRDDSLPMLISRCVPTDLVLITDKIYLLVSSKFLSKFSWFCIKSWIIVHKCSQHVVLVLFES